MKHILITYGNENYYNSLKRIEKEAWDTQHFDEVRIVTDKDLPSTVTSNVLFSQKRGGGYWLWKPYIIMEALKTLDDEDILCYVDCGCKLYNDKEWDKWFEYLATNDAIFFQTGGLNKNWTRKSLLEYEGLSVPTHFKELYQCQSTLMLAKKSALPLFETYYQTMAEHPECVLDVPAEEKHLESPDFIEHRHDQSVLTSCIYHYRDKLKLKIVWQRVEGKFRNGQAVFAARIDDHYEKSKFRGGKNVKFEPWYITWLKKILIYPYRNHRIWYYKA